MSRKPSGAERGLRIWTIGDARVASTRLRIHQYLPLLAADGIDTRVERVANGFLPRLIQLGRVRREPRLILQKRLFSPRAVTYLRSRCEHLVFDVDDAVYLDGEGSRKNRTRWDAVTGAADRVLVGNRFLAAATADPKRTRILPTPIDTTATTPSPPGARDRRLVVWIGSRTNLHNLDVVFPVFARIHQRDSRTRLLVVADTPPLRPPAGCHFEAWSPETERRALGEAGAGIMPLLDTPMNRGKCGFKILLYQAAGLPVIASPVGINPDLIEPGADGALASDEEQWEDALVRVLSDPGLQDRWGAAARARVVKTHSVETLYPHFRDAILGED